MDTEEKKNENLPSLLPDLNRNKSGNTRLFLIIAGAIIVALVAFTIGKGLYDNYQEGLARDRVAQAEKARELERQANLDRQRKEVEEQQAAEQKAQQRQQEYKVQLDQLATLKIEIDANRDKVTTYKSGVDYYCNLSTPTDDCDKSKSWLAQYQSQLEQKVKEYNALAAQLPPDVAKYIDKFDQNGNAVQ